MPTAGGSFPMSLDRQNRLMTGLVLVVMAVVLLVQVVACRGTLMWIPWLTASILAVAMGSSWAFAPSALEVDGGELRVTRRMWRPFTVPLPEIERVESAPPLRTSSAVRLFGVGGFFGNYGLFWIRGIGRVRAFLTRCDSGLLLRRRGGLPILLSPDDPAAASAALGRFGIAVASDLAGAGERG